MCGLEKSTHLAWGLEIKGDAVSGLLAKAEQMLPVVRVFANDLGDQALQRIRPPAAISRPAPPGKCTFTVVVAALHSVAMGTSTRSPASLARQERC